jgi:hypothetical protein
MRRRRHSLQVSTFPFLAVLLCTMGSLILVLLVMDRKSRQAALARAKREAARVAQQQAEAVAARRAEWERQQQQAREQWQRRRDQLHRRLAGEQAVLDAQSEQVARQLAEAAARLRAEQAGKEQTARQARALHERLSALQHAVAQPRSEQARRAADGTPARTELAAMTAELARLEQTVRDLRAAREQQRQTYSVVPYRGKHGDARRPLYVECVAAGLIFHPDKSLLVLTTPQNVKDEVTRRLARQRSHRDGADPAPYLLLLVRPEGILSANGLQGVLREMNIDFGYELVDADWILDFPPDDQALTQPWMTAQAPTAAPPLASPAGPPPGKPMTNHGSHEGIPITFAGDPRPRGDSTSPPGQGGARAPGAGGVGLPGTQPIAEDAALPAPGVALGPAAAPGVAAGPSTGLPGAGRPDHRPGGPLAAQGGGGASLGLPPLDAQPGARPGEIAVASSGTPQGRSGLPGTLGSDGVPLGRGAGGTNGDGRRLGTWGGSAAGTQPGIPGTLIPGSAPLANAGQGPAALVSPGQPIAGTDASCVMASPGAATAGRETTISPGGGPVSGQPGAATGSAPPGPQGDSPLPGNPSGPAVGGAGARGLQDGGTARSSGTAPGGGSGVVPGVGDGSNGTGSQSAAPPAEAHMAGASQAGVGPDPPGTPDTPPAPAPAGPPSVAIPRSAPADGGGDEQGGSAGAAAGRFAPQGPPLRARGPRRTIVLHPARLRGDRDWVVFVECRSNGVVVYPTARSFTLAEVTSPANPLLSCLQEMIARRQALVRPGELPYRPHVRFLVRPEHLRTYHTVFPALDALQVPKSRQNLAPEDDVAAIVYGS